MSAISLTGRGTSVVLATGPTDEEEEAHYLHEKRDILTLHLFACLDVA